MCWEIRIPKACIKAPNVGIHIERRKLDFWAHQKKNSFSYILTKEELLINAIMALDQAADRRYDGVNILNASDESARQSVPHLHIHIIPRKRNDRIDA